MCYVAVLCAMLSAMPCAMLYGLLCAMVSAMGFAMLCDIPANA